MTTNSHILNPILREALDKLEVEMLSSHPCPEQSLTAEEWNSMCLYPMPHRYGTGPRIYSDPIHPFFSPTPLEITHPGSPRALNKEST